MYTYFKRAGPVVFKALKRLSKAWLVGAKTVPLKSLLLRRGFKPTASTAAARVYLVMFG